MDHQWKFFRAGGFDQVRLTNGQDIAALAHLDQKLWMALGCPTSGVEFDHRTLSLIDLDNDGRIRVTEIISAIAWLKQCLKSLDSLIPGAPCVQLDEIDPTTEEGKRVLASAKRILANLGKPDATVVELEDVSDTARILSHTRLNGDGVIPPEAAEGEVAILIEEIMRTIGSDTDRAGKAGVSQALVEAFFSEVHAHAAWLTGASSNPSILFLGERSGDAFAAFLAVRDKVLDYFTRTRLASYEPRAIDKLSSSDEALVALGKQLLKPTDDALSSLPLAKVEPGRALPLREQVNPAWSERMQRFAELVVQPVLGKREVLTADEFAQLTDRVAAYEAWQATQAGVRVAALGAARVQQLSQGNLRSALEVLIAEDKALEPEIANITQVEKLVRLKRDFFQLLNNFVSFTDFYQRKGKAIFQAGTLYLDQRSCELVIRVEDPTKHATFAGRSRMYLAYCEAQRRGSNEKSNIVAAFTNGDSLNLTVGRNGVFYDREGKDWDATIVKIVDNPISIREAFFAPYRKVASLIEQQIERFASSREKAQQQAAADHIAAAAEAQKPPPAPFDVAKFAGIFAAIGLAVGAITGAFGAMFAAFIKLAWWQMPLAVAGLLLVVSGPSMLLAWLKLRQRNLGPILDANGWAVNSDAKVNLPLGEALTAIAQLPPGAQTDTYDPFAIKHPWRKWILFGIFLGLATYAAWQKGELAWLWSKVAQRSENAPMPSGKPTATPMPPPATAPLSAENTTEAKKPLAEPINAPAAPPSATPASK